MKTLAEAGHAEYRPYEGVRLTAEGRAVAMRMLRRHRLIELFLAKTLDLTWDQVHEEAEHMEHAVSDRLIDRIDFRHGGKEYDDKYPDGIPTSLDIEHDELGTLSSGLVMYPEGHARNTSGHLDRLLKTKFERLAAFGVDDVAIPLTPARVWALLQEAGA